MDPICKEHGCYMYAPGTSERRYCEHSCHIERCVCGHQQADHYVKEGWPACSLCTECKEFTPADGGNDAE